MIIYPDFQAAELAWFLDFIFVVQLSTDYLIKS